MVSKDQREVWLVEYQKAQDSAQHYDTLIWTSSGFFVALVGALIGLIASSERTDTNSIILILLGMIALIFQLGFVNILGCYKNMKYKRCKDLEEKLGMQQHRSTECKNCGLTLSGTVLLKFFIVVLLVVLGILLGIMLC